ncbi:MAG TPA: hypothetical protein PKJ97_03115 [Candidatus Bilamarchaeaceae archaeon]|nr:hypothetical protein [Candidatus Bilamarchaeaceae archaeon]
MEYPAYFASITAATIVLLAGYIALLHMGSRFFSKPEMAAYANVELQNLFISAVIFVAAISIFFASEQLASSIGLKPGEKSMHDVSISFLQKVISNGVMPAYVDLVSLDLKLSFWSAMQGRHGPTVWNFTFKQVTGLEPIISVVRILTFTLTAFLGTLSAQVVIFYLIKALMPIVLACGVLVRFFPPARDAGTYLIVFAIAFQSFFPLLFVMNVHILDEVWAAHGWGDSYAPYMSIPKDLRVQSFGEIIPDALQAKLASMQFDPSTVAEVFGFLPFMSFLRFAALIPFFEGIASLSLPALFLPAITMSLTISFINALTKFFTGKG